MRHAFIGLCMACLLLTQATPAKAEVVFYATADRGHQENWNDPGNRTTIAIKTKSGDKEVQKAAISVQGSKTKPNVRIISGGTPDITYKVLYGEKNGDWFVVFESVEGVYFNQDYVLAVEITAEGGANFPVKIKFKAAPPPPEGNGGGVLSSQAWRGKLTLQAGYSVSSTPSGKAGHGAYLTIGGSLYTWEGKYPISIVLEGNLVYRYYKLDYNTEGKTKWAHVNSILFQPRIGVRFSIPFNEKGLGLHVVPFAGMSVLVIEHDNDVTGLSDDLRLHLIHGRLEVPVGLALGVRVVFYVNHWFGFSAELAWAGTWDTLKEVGEPVVFGFSSGVYGNFGASLRF